MTNSQSHSFTDISPVINADGLAYVVFERRDVATMGKFLIDFGFMQAEQEGKSTYFRGFGDLPYCVELIASERDVFLGFGLVAARSDDLNKFAEYAGITPIDREQPGGGLMVRLTDPGGFQVDLVHGMAPVAVQNPRYLIVQKNTPWEKERVNMTVRPPAGPAPVRGLGHVVLQFSDFEGTARWYMERFGFLPTDLFHVGGKTGSFGLGFFRFNRGSEPADHHSLAILAGPEPQLLHVSTETIDMDAVGQGQQHLRAQGYTHHWGIGRHVFGSQIFDYWKDTAGDEWEHYADGDVMTAKYPTGIHKLDRGGLWAWGDDLPASLRPPGPAPEEAPQEVKDLVDALLAKPRPWLD